MGLTHIFTKTYMEDLVKFGGITCVLSIRSYIYLGSFSDTYYFSYDFLGSKN